jgi:hypothetical protein
MRKNGIYIIGSGDDKPRMEISEVAAQQIADHYSDRGVTSRANIREAIRKWNANQEPTTLAEAAMFDVIREIEKKTQGLIP